MKKNSEQLRREAIKSLVDLGVCKYMKDMDLYHGRANTDGKVFEVYNFDNAGNNTGNENVSKLSGLYVSEFDFSYFETKR